MVLRRVFGGTDMPTLKVDLQEGFSGETIELRLDGKEIYRGKPITRTQIGLAESQSFDLPPRHLRLEIANPASGVIKGIDLDLFQDFYVGVTLSPNGTFILRSSLQPFGYV